MHLSPTSKLGYLSFKSYYDISYEFKDKYQISKIQNSASCITCVSYVFDVSLTENLLSEYSITISFTKLVIERPLNH